MYTVLYFYVNLSILFKKRNIVDIIQCFNQFFYTVFGIYNVYDIIEIFLITLIIIKLLNFIANAQVPFLNTYTYTCGILFIFAQYTHMHSLEHIILVIGPVLLLGVCILHQERVQKNFIGGLAKKQPIEKKCSIAWIESVIKAVLHSQSHNHHISIVIQRNDHVASLFSIKVPINAYANTSLCSFIMMKSDHNSYIIINDHGIIIGCNSYWLTSNENHVPLSVLERNDAVFIVVEHNLFTLMTGKYCWKRLSSIDLNRILKQIFIKQQTENYEAKQGRPIQASAT